ARLTAGYSDPATLDAYSIRVDHAFGSRVTLFGRYSDTPSHTTQRTPAGPSQLTTTDYHTRTLTMGLTQIISPLLSNEFRASYNDSHAGSILAVDPFQGATPRDPAALFQALNFPGEVSPQNGFLFSSVTSTSFYAAGKNAINKQHQVNLVDTVSLVTGAH